jgi:hypothetical protein
VTNAGVVTAGDVTPGSQAVVTLTFTDATTKLQQHCYLDSGWHLSIGTLTEPGFPTNGCSIAGTQSICSGGDPLTFSNISDGTGDGAITYRWDQAPQIALMALARSAGPRH